MSGSEQSSQEGFEISSRLGVLVKALFTFTLHLEVLHVQWNASGCS